MDGISGSGLGYAGGRTGYMGQSDMDAFSGFGYAGGRTGYMGQSDNHAFNGFGQANNPGVANPGPAANPATNQNNNPLKAINSKVFGRGTFNAPFFGQVSAGQAVIGGLVALAIIGYIVK